MKKILVFLILILTFNTNVSAASMCSSEEKVELNQKAANIKAKYEVVEEKYETLDFPYEATRTFFNIHISNISEEFYIVVRNEDNNFNQNYYYANSNNGIITIKWENMFEVSTFSLEVYTTDKTGCPNEKLKTLYLTTPRYNSLSENYLCDEYNDFYLCAEYVNFAVVSEEKFFDEFDKYIKKIEKKYPQEGLKQEEENKFIELIDNYKWYIISGVIIIAGIGFAVIIIKKRKYRELGL